MNSIGCLISAKSGSGHAGHAAGGTPSTAAYRERTPGSAALAARAAGLFPSGVTHDGRYLEPYGIYGRWRKVRLFFEIFPLYRRATFKRQRGYLKTERMR